LSDWAERRLEQLCLGQADMVVAVSDGITEDLAAAGANPRLLTVRNGIERLAAGEARPAGDAFRIVYVGSFYHTRDPFPFLEAVGRVVEERRLRPEQLTVRFIGTTDVFGGRSIPAFIAERGLERFVRLEGWMEREACLAEVASADALLLLAMEQPTQVPNKVYEYLGTRRPILAIADSGGETARMLRRSGGHEVVTENDPDLIEDAVRRLIDRADRGPVGDEVRLVEWTTKNQMAKLVEAIGGVDVG
jgi:glycosyltransferase involved in cell wall biosynthesis